ILSALGTLVLQLLVSIRDRDKARVPLGDPWNGRTLEWAIPSPPPEYNFALIPRVGSRDCFAEEKAAGQAYRMPSLQDYEDIELPRNTPIGMVFCVGATLLGFALTWHIWWLAIASLVAMVVCFVGRSFNTDTTMTIPAAEIAREHQGWLAEVAADRAVRRDEETEITNRGLAALELPEPAR
ncbi:MAG: cytochrome ubiquinol oxidase subunit I, partial [Pseudomonadota bacterium]